MEPTVIATRCGSYKSLFDRRSGLITRYMGQCQTPLPELLELEPVGPQGQFLDLGLLSELLSQAPLCRQVLLVGPAVRHPALPWILRAIREQGAVPSIALPRRDQPNAEVARAILRFAGAVSVHAESTALHGPLLSRLHDADVRVSTHFALADDSASRAIDALQSQGVGPHIDRLLLAGRHGTGRESTTAHLGAARAIRQCRALVQKLCAFRIGLDARTASLVASKEKRRQALLPRCEAGRTGLFIHHDGQVSPCSLLGHRIVGTLRHQSLWRIWTGLPLVEFRRHQGLAAPCRRIAIPCGRDRATPLEAIPNGQQQDLRFGFAASSLCDRTVVALAPEEIVQVLGAVHEWQALRFFVDDEDGTPGHAPASWSNLEFFLSIAPLWGQDLARLHEQLVAGTFERQELALPGQAETPQF